MGTPAENDHDLLIQISTKLDMYLESRERDREEYDRDRGEDTQAKQLIWDRLRELDLKVAKLAALAGVGGTVCGALLSAGISFVSSH